MTKETYNLNLVPTTLNPYIKRIESIILNPEQILNPKRGLDHLVQQLNYLKTDLLSNQFDCNNSEKEFNTYTPLVNYIDDCLDRC